MLYNDNITRIPQEVQNCFDIQGHTYKNVSLVAHKTLERPNRRNFFKK